MVLARGATPRFDTAAADQRLAQQKLDLSVEAAELIRSPTAQFLEIFGVEPQQECFSLSHDYW